MIGNNSCGVHSLMGLGTGRTSDQVHELDILLYDGTRMTVGATTEEELERIIRDGGRKGEIYARLRDLRDRYADEIRRRYPKNLPAPGLRLQPRRPPPREGLPRRPGAVGHRGDVRHHPGGAASTWSPARPSSRSWCSAIPTSTARATTSPRSCESKPTGLEGIDDVLVRDMKKKGIHPKDITLLPEGGGWLLVEFGGESKRGVRRQGPRADGPPQGRSRTRRR